MFLLVSNPSNWAITSTQVYDVVAELKEKKVPGRIQMEEKNLMKANLAIVLRQTPASGPTYDLSKATTITLTVAKKVTSVSMPNYIGSSLEFTKNNLWLIVGSEANIEVEAAHENEPASLCLAVTVGDEW